jgi:hypothetical protein
MQFGKIAAAILIGLWMLWMSWQMIVVKRIALEACGLAATGGMNENGGIKLPVVCPDLENSEVK